MIDFENKIFTEIYNAVIASYPDAYIAAEEENIEPKFPAVYISVTDSYQTSQFVNSSRTENFRDITVDINVYTNINSGRKTQAKHIITLVNDEMLAMGFMGASLNVLDLTSSDNKLVTRLFARYRASVDSNGIFYSRRY